MTVDMFFYLGKHRCVYIFPVSDVDQGIEAQSYRKAFLHRAGCRGEPVGKRSGLLFVLFYDLLWGDRVGEDHAVTGFDLVEKVFPY